MPITVEITERSATGSKFDIHVTHGAKHIRTRMQLQDVMFPDVEEKLILTIIALKIRAMMRQADTREILVIKTELESLDLTP